MSESPKDDTWSADELKRLRKRIEELEKSEATFNQTENTLRESEGLFKNVYLQSPIAIELYDANGKLLDANPACLTLFGVQSVEEVRGFDLFTDPNISDEDRIRLEKGEQVSFESTFDFELVKQMKLYNTSKSGVCYIDCHITPIQRDKGDLTGYLVHVRDITERKHFAHILEQSEKRFRSLIEHSTDAITLIDKNGKVLYESPYTYLLTGYTSEERLGRSGFGLIHPDDLPKIKAVFDKVLASAGTVEKAQFRSVKKDGTVWWTEGTAINLLHEPSVQAIVVNYRNITDGKNAEQALKDMNDQLNTRVAEIEELQIELQQQALRDPLTGLYNRRHLADALEREMARVLREKISMSVIVMDIDHFKRINDNHGHQIGDLFLKTIADLIAGHCRTSDTACRYGGEEFLLVLPGTPLNTAADRAEELRKGCSEIRIQHENKDLKITMSLGVASYPEHGKKAEEIVIKADKALYHSKHRGRNRVSIWSKNWQDEEINQDE